MQRNPNTIVIIPIWFCAVIGGLIAYGKNNAENPIVCYVAAAVIAALFCAYLGWLFSPLVDSGQRRLTPLPENAVRRYLITAATQDGYSLADNTAISDPDPYDFSYPKVDNSIRQVLIPYDTPEMYSDVVNFVALYGGVRLCLVVNPDGSRRIDLWDATDSLLHAVGKPEYHISALTVDKGRTYVQGFKVVPFDGLRTDFAGHVPANMFQDDSKCVLYLTPNTRSRNGSMGIFIQVDRGDVDASPTTTEV